MIYMDAVRAADCRMGYDNIMGILARYGQKSITRLEAVRDKKGNMAEVNMEIIFDATGS